MKYKEIETRNGSRVYFYRDNICIAMVDENGDIIPYTELTENELNEIKKTTS